jgi:DNA-binding GntR family transcriptional regulator
VTQTTTRPEHGGLREHVVDQLRREIVDGTLPPGTPLRTEAIMERFGVSNSPLREAFAQLAAEGLVEVFRNRGVVVAPLTRDSAADLIRVSSLLWETAFRWAIPRLTSGDLSTLRRMGVDFDLAYRSGDAISAILDAERLERFVMERCGSEELLRAIESSTGRVARVRRFLGPEDHIDASAELVSETIAAAEAPDAERAVLAVRALWKDLSDSLDAATLPDAS